MMDKTKTKLIQKIPLLALIGLLSVLIPSRAFAHGPETHKINNQCNAEYFETWWGAGQCDPGSPKDISGGITKESNPSGLCYPSFNNFIDEAQENGHGMDPYDSYPALFKDERNFFKVSKIDEGDASLNPSKFSDDITVKDGDTLLFLIYMHNDGDPCLNKDITTKTGKVKDWNTTAYDVSLSISNFIFGEASIKGKTKMQASIKGSNVINEFGKKGEVTSDDVNISPESGELELKYIEGTAEYVDMRDDPGKLWWYNNHPIANPAPLFGTKGLPLSTVLVNGEFKAGGGQGIYFASEPYVGIVRFKVKVEKPKPNICKTLELTESYQLSTEELKKYTGSEKNGPMYKLAVKKFTFEQFPYPPLTKIKFTSTDPKGKFWLVDFFGAISPLNKNSHEAFIDEFLTNAMTNQIFYTGTGTVTATLTNIPENQANPNVCTDSVTFQPPTEKEKVCKEILIDHPKTIYTGTVSTFKSEARDQNGDQFTSYIEYSVDEGYGLFFTTYPFGYDANKSEMAYEVKGVTPYMQFIFNAANSVLLNFIDEKSAALQNLAKYTQTSLLALPTITLDKTIDGTPTPTLEQPGFKTEDLTLSIEELPYSDSSLDKPTVSDDPMMPTGETPKTDGDKPKTGIIGIGGTGSEYVGTLSTYEDISVKKPFDPRNVELAPVFSANDLKVLLPYKNPKNEILNPNGQTKIVVAQGTTVYFYAEKDGVNKVHVKTINSDAKACKRDFSIVKSPVVIRKCEDIKVNHNSTIFEKKLSKFSAKGIEEKTKKTFNGKITYSVAEGYGTFYISKPQNKEENTTTFVQEFTGKVTPPEGGKFCSDKGTEQTARSGSSVTVDPGEEVYFWAEKPGKEVITVDTNCSITTNCARKFDIAEVPKVNICDSLAILDKPASIKVGQEVTLKVGARDQLGATVPQDTKLIWTTDTEGTIAFKMTTDQNGTLKVNFSDQPVKFSGSKKAGVIEVSLDPQDKYYNPKCKDFIPVVEEEKPLICTDLAPPLIKKYPSNETVTKMMQGEIYTAKGKPTFSKPYPQAEIVYSIDPNIGTFVTMGNASEVLKNVILTGLKQKRDEGLLTSQFVNQFLEEMNRVNPEIQKAPVIKVKAKPDETVYFVTYSDSNPVARNTFSAEVYGFSDIAACTDTFPLEIVPKECKSLLIEPVKGNFDPANDQYTSFRLTGNFKNHNGTVDVTTNCGSLSKTGNDQSFTAQNISFFSNEVKNSNDNLTFYYKSDAACTNKNITLSAKAVGTAAGICEDQLSKFKPGEKEIKCVDLNIITPESPWILPNTNKQFFQAKITTNPTGEEKNFHLIWKVTNGKGEWQNEETTSNGLNWLLNFDANIATAIKVTAIDLNNNKQEVPNCTDSLKTKKDKEEGEISKAVYADGNYNAPTNLLNIGAKKNGKNENLTYKIVYTNGSAKEVEIQETAFEANGKIFGSLDGGDQGTLDIKGIAIHIDEDNAPYTIFKTAGYKDESKSGEDKSYNTFGNDHTLDAYEVDFNCNNGKQYGKVCLEGDFNQIEDDFKDGKFIKFENLQDDTIITIKVQVENNSGISESVCKNLKAIKGCGESFENKAQYQVPKTSETGKDTAKVIVICPFILAREGGDVFFHDVVETGVDVAKCAKVKSAQGPVITPTKAKTGQIVSSGAGDEFKDILLTLPSHDICKYSNLDVNLEGYNNVLENFSSTICELKAEVAKEWKEANIVKAINDNITRIARFGENLNGVPTINSMNDLENVTNKQSGVFVKEGDLTIDLDTNEITDVDSEIPAAQTYIVKNGNLTIKSNIKYRALKLPDDFLNPKNIPAAAFIVIDGNIIIEDGVTQIDGVLMAVNTDPAADSSKGKITNKSNDRGQDTTSNRQLTINGNLIGNVYELFKSRIFVGDPEKDEGSVTIRYDERIMLNTPPGLSELINLKQTIVPN
ncbi:hypothetical protein HY604_03160 [Candidatus Peregrinibacteria bacterium]|nr:hypothetical protein [Candidatus Peregrinibacteria bacterium]